MEDPNIITLTLTFTLFFGAARLRKGNLIPNRAVRLGALHGELLMIVPSVVAEC